MRRAEDDERFQREAETVHRPAWGGRVGGSVSVPTPSGSKESPHAAMAAHWRRRPAARGPANQFSACREELGRFESRTSRWQLACHPQAAANISIHSTMRGDAREASRQNKRRVCPRAIYGAVGWTAADYGDLLRRRIPGQPEAIAGHGVTAIEVGEHEDGRIGVRHDHPGIRDAPTAWRSTWRPRVRWRRG